MMYWYREFNTLMRWCCSLPFSEGNCVKSALQVVWKIMIFTMYSWLLSKWSNKRPKLTYTVPDLSILVNILTKNVLCCYITKLVINGASRKHRDYHRLSSPNTELWRQVLMTSLLLVNCTTWMHLHYTEVGIQKRNQSKQLHSLVGRQGRLIGKHCRAEVGVWMCLLAAILVV